MSGAGDPSPVVPAMKTLQEQAKEEMLIDGLGLVTTETATAMLSAIDTLERENSVLRTAGVNLLNRADTLEAEVARLRAHPLHFVCPKCNQVTQINPLATPLSAREDVEAEPTPEQVAAAERAWDALDAIADKWAEEINLTAWIKNIVQVARLNKSAPDDVRETFIHRQESLIDAFVRQAFSEGFYRGSEGRKEYERGLLSTKRERG